MISDKQKVDVIISACKEYINSVLEGFSGNEKSLASFEQKHMGQYVGGAPIDHVAFRRFLRLYDPEDIKNNLAKDKQDKVDDRLSTEDKTIVGAINELDAAINSGYMKKDASNYESDMPIVSPTISSRWVINNPSDGSHKIDYLNSVSVENGAIVTYSGHFVWTSDVNKKDPTRCDGNYGSNLPLSGVASREKLESNIITNKTYTVNLYAPKSGLEVSGAKIVKASGYDTASASARISFYHRRYWGESADPSIEITDIANSELSNSKAKTVTFNCSGGKYFYYAYPKALGDSSWNVGGLSFTGYIKSEVTIINEYGKSIEYYVYRSADIQTGSSIKAIIS